MIKRNEYERKITEEFVVNQIIKFMLNKENDNWHE